MVPAILDVTRVESSPVDTTARYLFRSSGTIVKFPGHTIVYMEGVDKELFAQKQKQEEEAEDSAERQLPELTEGERLRLVEQDGQTIPGVTSKQHFTQPPPRYNEALLIKELEEKGIGRPSTYAAIISTIQDRKYVEKVEGRFLPTETGRTVNDFLLKGFPDVVNVDFTSQLEEELDEVEEGNKPWVDAVRDFYNPFAADLEKAKSIPGPKDTVEPPTDIPCEKCGRMMEIKWGRNGKFLACPGYKDDPPCKNTQNFEKLPDGTHQNRPEAGTHHRSDLRKMREPDGGEDRPFREVHRLLGLPGMQDDETPGARREMSAAWLRRGSCPEADAKRPFVLCLQQISGLRICLVGSSHSQGLSDLQRPFPYRKSQQASRPQRAMPKRGMRLPRSRIDPHTTSLQLLCPLR